MHMSGFACPRCSVVVSRLLLVEYNVALEIFGPRRMCVACVEQLQQAQSDSVADWRERPWDVRVLSVAEPQVSESADGLAT